MSCSAAKKPCSSTKISLTDMAPAAQQSASVARAAKEVDSAGNQRNQSQRPPLPPRPPGLTPRPSLGSSEARGAPEDGLSAALPEAPSAAFGTEARVQRAEERESGRGLSLRPSDRHRQKQPAKAALGARGPEGGRGRACRWCGQAGLFSLYVCIYFIHNSWKYFTTKEYARKTGAEECRESSVFMRE